MRIETEILIYLRIGQKKQISVLDEVNQRFVQLYQTVQNIMKDACMQPHKPAE